MKSWYRKCLYYTLFLKLYSKMATPLIRSPASKSYCTNPAWLCWFGLNPEIVGGKDSKTRFVCGKEVLPGVVLGAGAQ